METVTLIAISVVTGVVSLIIYVLFLKPGAQEETNKPENETAEEPKKERNPSQSGGGDSKGGSKSKAKSSKHKAHSDTFTHPLLVTSMKGHSGSVTGFDVSSSGKYLISVADDRTLFLWTLKELGKQGLKSVRCNIELDTPRLIKFSPDNKSFIVSLENGNNIRVYKMNKSEDGNSLKIQPAFENDFAQTLDADMINIGIDSSGNFIMTSDDKTKIDLLSLRGDKLCSIDTGTMKNAEACVSPCGRFVAACGFTPDVKVWEVLFDKSRNFKSAKRAYDLKGHKAGLLSIAFSADSSRIASLSKDSTWKLWKTNVEFDRGQDPILMTTGTIEQKPDKAKIAISPDGRTVAVAIDNNITLYNGITQEKDIEIKAIFGSDVRQVAFTVDGRFLLCCGDRQVRAFHNITGYKAKISDFTNQLKSCDKNAERRLNDQLQETRKILSDLNAQTTA